MTLRESLVVMRERVEAFEKELADKAKEFAKDERVSPEQVEKLGSIEEKASAMKQKLPAEEGSVWEAIKHEIQRDMDALAQDFEHTVDYIDKHYREKK